MHIRFESHRRRFVLALGAVGLATALYPRDVRAQAPKLRIGVIGSGHIGGAIGTLWVKSGHEVMFSARKVEEVKDLVASLGPLAHAGTVAEAIAFGDVVFVAVPYAALPQIGQDYGAALKGKVVLDATNAVAARDGAITEEATRDGIGVTSQKYLPGTRLVRAFNSMSNQIFTREANRPEPRMGVPIAGDDPQAVEVAAGLVRDAGFEPVVIGKLADAKRFQMGSPGFGQSVTAAELRQKLAPGS